jgi:hypothetical protein
MLKFSFEGWGKRSLARRYNRQLRKILLSRERNVRSYRKSANSNVQPVLAGRSATTGLAPVERSLVGYRR